MEELIKIEIETHSQKLVALASFMILRVFERCRCFFVFVILNSFLMQVMLFVVTHCFEKNVFLRWRASCKWVSLINKG